MDIISSKTALDYLRSSQESHDNFVCDAEKVAIGLRAEIRRKDKLVEQMRQAIEIGLESTRELLHEFDKKHGRTTPKNRLYTERWEAQIKQMETALEAAERGKQ